MFKKLVWPFMIGMSAVMVVVFVAGFLRVMSITDGDDNLSLVQNINNQGNEDTLNEDQNALTDALDDNREILIVGDSIGAGIGDERNLGIGERYINQLDFEEGDLYDVINFSVPGAITHDLSKVISSGNIDDAIQIADLIIISIGGNDLNRIRNSDTTLQIVNFEEALADHLDNFEDVLSNIRVLNPTVSVAVLGLYNPYSDVNKEDMRMLQEWNYQTRINLLEFESTNIVPLYDVFEMNLDTLLSIDQFHPSGDGYELIAEMLHRIINFK